VQSSGIELIEITSVGVGGQTVYIERQKFAGFAVKLMASTRFKQEHSAVDSSRFVKCTCVFTLASRFKRAEEVRAHTSWDSSQEEKSAISKLLLSSVQGATGNLARRSARL
jgi:hypothetical protein